MKFTIVDESTNIVETVIEVPTALVDNLNAGLGMKAVLAEGYLVQNADVYNPATGLFTRGEYVVPKAATILDEINLAIDAYTMSLIEGGTI